MSSRREFLAAMSSTPVLSVIESVDQVDENATSLIVKLKSPHSMAQINRITDQCRLFNERRIACGHNELPILVIDDSRITIEQVTK